MKETLVRTFNNNLEAEAAKAILAKEGIKSVVQRRGITDSFVTVGHASIFVLEKDAEKARELLKDWIE